MAKILEAEVNFREHTNTVEGCQPTGFHFALVSDPKDGRKQCHTWIKCRDFLQDATRNALTGRADQIYSFRYDPKKDPKIDFRRTRVVVKKLPHPANDAQRADFTEMMQSGLAMIKHFETYAKWTPKTKLYKVRGDLKQYSFLFLGPGEWTQSSFGISMYTFLIRLGYLKIKFKTSEDLTKQFEKLSENPTNRDMNYLKTAHKHFYTLLDHHDKLKYKQPGQDKILFHDNGIADFHNRSGIVNICRCNTPDNKLNAELKKLLKQ